MVVGVWAEVIAVIMDPRLTSVCWGSLGLGGISVALLFRELIISEIALELVIISGL